MQCFTGLILLACFAQHHGQEGYQDTKIFGGAADILFNHSSNIGIAKCAEVPNLGAWGRPQKVPGRDGGRGGYRLGGDMNWEEEKEE